MLKKRYNTTLKHINKKILPYLLWNNWYSLAWSEKIRTWNDRKKIHIKLVYEWLLCKIRLRRQKIKYLFRKYGFDTRTVKCWLLDGRDVDGFHLSTYFRTQPANTYSKYASSLLEFTLGEISRSRVPIMSMFVCLFILVSLPGSFIHGGVFLLLTICVIYISVWNLY